MLHIIRKTKTQTSQSWPKKCALDLKNFIGESSSGEMKFLQQTKLWLWYLQYYPNVNLKHFYSTYIALVRN